MNRMKFLLAVLAVMAVILMPDAVAGESIRPYVHRAEIGIVTIVSAGVPTGEMNDYINLGGELYKTEQKFLRAISREYEAYEVFAQAQKNYGRLYVLMGLLPDSSINNLNKFVNNCILYKNPIVEQCVRGILLKADSLGMLDQIDSSSYLASVCQALDFNEDYQSTCGLISAIWAEQKYRNGQIQNLDWIRGAAETAAAGLKNDNLRSIANYLLFKATETDHNKSWEYLQLALATSEGNSSVEAPFYAEKFSNDFYIAKALEWIPEYFKYLYESGDARMIVEVGEYLIQIAATPEQQQEVRDEVCHSLNQFDDVEVIEDFMRYCSTIEL